MIIPVTYSAQWLRVPISYRDRYSVWSSPLSPYKAPMELHWYSIMNSIALVVILAAIVAFILFRVLKKDFQKYNDPENPVGSLKFDIELTSGQDFGEEDEYGWKMISGDVFRIPGHINILSAIVGVGVQFMVVGGSIMFITTTGIYNPTDDGTLLCFAEIDIIRPTYGGSDRALHDYLRSGRFRLILLVQKARRFVSLFCI